MDPGRLITRPYGASLRPHDGSGPPSRQGSRTSTEDSPTSEYSTPLASPVGRSSPQYATENTRSAPSRGQQPPRPPRPTDVMPLQAAKVRNYHLPMRAISRSNEDLAQSAGISPTSRKTPVVPPPSSRAPGTSPYAAPRSFSPILEESPDPSRRHASVASSRAVPSSWGSHPDDYNFDRMRERFEDDEDFRHSSTSPDSQVSGHDDTTSLVRQASMGKKMKPSLTKIRQSSQSSESARKKSGAGLSTITAGVATGSSVTSPGSNPSPPLPFNYSPSPANDGNRTIIIDSSSSDTRRSSEDSGSKPSTVLGPISRSRSPLASLADRSARQPPTVYGNVDRPVSHGPSMNEKILADRRPPSLDMEAVKKSDIRGSATSLPDLIRRATKLAANLDRGKTASRQNMLDMGDAEKRERRRSGSISDILASFPPPSRGTPDGARYSGFRSPFSPLEATSENVVFDIPRLR